MKSQDRIFALIPNVAFLKVVAGYSRKGRYLTIEDQFRALFNYCHYAAGLN